MPRKRNQRCPIAELASERRAADAVVALQIDGCRDERQKPIVCKPSNFAGAIEEWQRRLKNVAEFYGQKDGIPGFVYPRDGDRLLLLLLMRHVPFLRFVPPSHGPDAYWTEDRMIAAANKADEIIERRARDGYTGSERCTDVDAAREILNNGKLAAQFSGPRSKCVTVQALAKRISEGRSCRDIRRAVEQYILNNADVGLAELCSQATT